MTEISQFITRWRMERRQIEYRLEEANEIADLHRKFLGDKAKIDHTQIDRLKRILFAITQPHPGILEIKKGRGDTAAYAEVVVFDEDTEMLYRIWK